MTIHFREAYHLVEVTLQIIGIGTVLKGIAWLYKRKQENLENRVLDTFHSNKEDGPWQSVNGILGEIYLKAALRNARGFLPPRAPLTGWRAFTYRLRLSPYRLRHSFLKFFRLPSEKQVHRVLRDLWKRGLIRPADFDHTNNEFYRLNY